MIKYPSFQFYPGDHLKDPCLSMCSSATRGIWWDFLCAMHENGRSGRVTGTVEQLSRVGRCTAAEIRSTLDELKATRTAEVSERNGIVTVANRRMQREAQERDSTRLRVQKHRGNAPVTEMKRECNTPSSSSSSSSSSNKNPEENNSTTAQAAPAVREVFEHWRTALGHTEAKLTPKRLKSVKGRLREGYTVAELCAAVDGCRASPWHQGENDRNTVYDDLELICRSGEKVEYFRQMLSRPKGQNSNGHKSTGTYQTAAERSTERLRTRDYDAIAAAVAASYGDAEPPD